VSVSPCASVLIVISGTDATKLNHTSLLVLFGAQHEPAAGLPVLVEFTFVLCVHPSASEIGVALQIKSLGGACAYTLIDSTNDSAHVIVAIVSLKFFIS
jgi:hypothetical protein